MHHLHRTSPAHTATLQEEPLDAPSPSAQLALTALLEPPQQALRCHQTMPLLHFPSHHHRTLHSTSHHSIAWLLVSMAQWKMFRTPRTSSWASFNLLDPLVWPYPPMLPYYNWPRWCGTPQHSAPLTPKKGERRYFIPSKDTNFLFTHPRPNSLVVNATTECAPQQHLKSTPSPCCQETRLDGSQGFFISRATVPHRRLQFRITSYQAILAKYNFLSYSKLTDSQDSLPPD
ncbi:hypothetical protein KIL84_022534 [Mauremys mutica]|uniref:Uncharacterized protein n=1 Tax=Mauremys mutica TaxID=74926 RepID=A0A9D3WPZ9_9SAUR|nr:hypothetical protein KIL84_022534 [Mauremys mutica]